MARSVLFISSVQQELAAERRALKAFIANDALLRQHFEVFLFEDLPASDRRTDQAYLHEVDRCGLYIGLFGKAYGHTDAHGLRPPSTSSTAPPRRTRSASSMCWAPPAKRVMPG